MKFRLLLLLTFCLYGVPVSVNAANLTVMPTSLKLEPPKVADTVTIRNESRMPVKMQVRIFRWVQKGGQDVYYPTTDVIASPPFITIKGGADGNIRVARVSDKPIAGLESYRLIIDELPRSRVRQPVSSRETVIEVVTRQILPVFFNVSSKNSAALSSNALKFHAQAVKGGYQITIENPNDGVVRLGRAVLLASGKQISNVSSVIGNILPKSKLNVFFATKGGGKPQVIRVLNGKVSTEYPIQ